jgi:hypothetical protein
MNPTQTNIAQPNPILESLQPTNPSDMPRTHLTTIQITDTQKEVIDRAYAIRPGANQTPMTKGDFLELIATEYLQRHGGIQNRLNSLS